MSSLKPSCSFSNSENVLWKYCTQSVATHSERQNWRVAQPRIATTETEHKGAARATLRPPETMVGDQSANWLRPNGRNATHCGGNSDSVLCTAKIKHDTSLHVAVRVQANFAPIMHNRDRNPRYKHHASSARQQRIATIIIALPTMLHNVTIESSEKLRGAINRRQRECLTRRMKTLDCARNFTCRISRRTCSGSVPCNMAVRVFFSSEALYFSSPSKAGRSSLTALRCDEVAVAVANIVTHT